MNIILLERIEKLGQIGDLVSVKAGYARNFLLPQGKAVFASKENIKIFEDKKAQLEGENIERKKEAQDLSKNINFKEIVEVLAQNNYQGWFIVEAEQDPGKANPFEYAKIGYKELVECLNLHGYQIEEYLNE